MRSILDGAKASVRSLAPGTFAAACSGRLSSIGSPAVDTQSRATPAMSRPDVACSIFEVDPPIPVALPTAVKVELAMQRARLVSCNPTMVSWCGYASMDEVEGASIGDLAGPSAQESFRDFFDHDLRYAGPSHENDANGSARSFDHRMVGLERNGMLYELIQTKRIVPSCSGFDAPQSFAPPSAAGLVDVARRLGRDRLAAALDRVHTELMDRRHALRAHQEHAAPRSLGQRLRAARRGLPPDPQALFARAQTTVLSVLGHTLHCAQADASASPPGTRCARMPGGACVSARELARRLRGLDRVLPGAGERMIAEILLHWKAKEALERRRAGATSPTGHLRSLFRAAVTLRGFATGRAWAGQG